ncbi:MAG: hypothetical protein RLN75_06000, partial [Longimicrobiales bacterium]
MRRESAGADDPLTGQPALLFVHLLDRGTSCARSELATLFWPDADPSRGRHGLRQALSRIRKALGSEAVEGTDPVGARPTAVTWDVVEFEQALDRGDLDGALDLWRGPFLNGAAEGQSWEISEWIERRRRELEALLLDAGRGAVRALMKTEDFESALHLVEQLQDRVAGDRGLAVDAAELLVELGRPHEAEARLEGAEVDRSQPRVAGILKRARRTRPEPPALPPVAPSPSDDPFPAPGEGRPGARPSRRAPRVALALVGAAALAAVLIGFFRPAPLDDVSIWFCGHRETRYGFVVEFPERSISGVLTEPGCPILPLGGDSVLALVGDPDTGARVVVFAGGGQRTVLELPWAWPTLPLRRAGAQDGVISPDGRHLLLNVERPREASSAPAVPPPGVPGSIGAVTSDWDVVLVDITTGAVRDIAPGAARVWDARFTPDGDAVVYVSDETGGGDLYRHDLATGTTTRLTRDPRLERTPVVGRRFTVFMAGAGTDDDPEQVMVLDHATGDVTARVPSAWSQGPPELSPVPEHVSSTDTRR